MDGSEEEGDPPGPAKGAGHPARLGGCPAWWAQLRSQADGRWAVRNISVCDRPQEGRFAEGLSAESRTPNNQLGSEATCQCQRRPTKTDGPGTVRVLQTIGQGFKDMNQKKKQGWY